MSMFERLGLGISLDLQDNMTDRVNPLINDLDRLQRAARQTTESFNNMGRNMRGMGSSMSLAMYRNMYSTMRSGMQDVGRASLQFSRNLIMATTAMNQFRHASNSLQAMGTFNRAYGMIMNTQRTLGMMGFGMSGLQEHQRSIQAFNMLNYTVKDLQDRIKLTERGIREMMASPDAHKFTEQINLARRSLAELKNEMSKVNTEQKLMETYGLKSATLGGKTVWYEQNAHASRTQTLANRLLGASYLDVARASMSAYNNIDKTAKKMIGMGYTTMEARQKITALAMSFQMLGPQITMYVTAPILLATGALTALISKMEEAHNTFQARTFVSDKQMKELGGFRDLMDDVSVNVGATMKDTANAFSISQISLGKSATAKEISDNAENALFFSKVWGVDTQKSINDVLGISKKLGVSNKQAWDMYATGARQAQEKGRKLSSYRGADEIQKTVLGNAGYYKKATGKGGEYSDAMGQLVENYDEKGGLAHLAEYAGEVGNIFKQFWYSVEDGVNKFTDKFQKKVLDPILEFTRGLRENHPHLMKWVVGMSALGLATVAMIGPIMTVTGYALTYRNVLRGYGSSLFGLFKGGNALLDATSIMAKERMDGMIVAFARFPQTLWAITQGLYGVIRGIPVLLARIAMINPMLVIAGFALVAYIKNWGGFKDTVNGYVDDMKKKWKELVDWYEKSSLPETFKRWGEYAKSFGQGFTEGLGVAIDLGKMFVNFVLEPIKQMLNRIDPLLTSVSNFISQMFGGTGNLKEGKDTWEKIGKIVGAIVGGFIILKGIGSITTFIVSPFKKMAESVTGATASVDRLILRMGRLSSMGFTGLLNTPRTIGSVVASTARTVGRTIWNNPNPALLTGNNPAQLGIVQRGWNMFMSPFRGSQRLLANGLASLGIGRGIAMGRQMTGLRQSGLALRNNTRLMDFLNNQFLPPNAQRVSATGSFGGRQVYQARQTALGRALFGTKLMTYTPVRNAQGQITGYERNDVGRTGGLLRGATNGFLGIGRFFGGRGDELDRNGITRGQRLVNGARAGLGTAGSYLWNNPASMFLRNQASALGGGIASPIRNGFRRFMANEARGFDRLTQNRFARGLAGAGRWAGGRLEAAGIRNPFAGALDRSGVNGPMTRRQATANFLRRTVGGVGSLAMSSVGTVGRGAIRGVGFAGRTALTTARIGARVATAPLAMAGRALGGLLAFAPQAMMLGMVGKFAYDKLGKGKDGKTSVANIAGNIDKLTANMGKSGGKGVTEFWNKFKKYGGDIMKSLGNLLVATFKTVAPKIPGILKDAWNGIKALAKITWNWIKTDGVKMAIALGTGLMDVLGKAWEWIKTSGVKYLGMALGWVVKTGLPMVIKGIGALITWIVGTALPNLLKFAWNILKKLWTWFIDDGYKQLWSLVKGVGKVALDIGKAIFKGIIAGLKGLGNAIFDMLPSGAQTIVKKFFGGNKAKAHARGGIINTPHLGLVGEAGPEAIIPLSGNMRGIAGNLLSQTANTLGYNVTPKGSASAIRKGGNSSSGSQDNSLTIQNMQVHFPKEMAGVGEKSAKQQAQMIMKELQKIMKQERLRQGNKNLTLEDVILGN